MAGGGGISGVAVGVVTAGAVLVYAGIKDLSPLDALRAIAGGKTPAVAGAGASGTPAPATPGSSGKSGLTPGPDAGHAGGGSGGGGGGSW